MELSADRRSSFLAELARHGIVARAARAASPHSSTGCVKTFRDERARNAEFALAWDECMEEAKGNVESELHRRAVEGWDEPIYGGKNREQVVGTVRRYSDRLLELRAKALLPAYRDKSQVELAGHVGQSPTDELRDGLARLNREQRAEMRVLLVRMGGLLGGTPQPGSLASLGLPVEEAGLATATTDE